MDGLRVKAPESVQESSWQLCHKVIWTAPYLKILSDVKDSSDVKRVFFIKIAERARQIRRFDLPNPHEDKLMVRVASQEHGKEFLAVF